MENKKKALRKKGWPEKDIDKTISILKQAEQKKHKSQKRFDRSVLWIAFIVILLSSFIISIMLFPLLLVLDTLKLIIVLLFVGTAFGIVYSVILHDIEILSNKHYTIFAIFLFGVIMATTFYLSNAARKIDNLLGIAYPENNWVIIGIAYSIFFILPYFVHEIFFVKK